MQLNLHGINLQFNCTEELQDYSNSAAGSNTSELSDCTKNPEFFGPEAYNRCLKIVHNIYMAIMHALNLIANCMVVFPDDLFDESWQLSMAHFISLILLCINLEQFETLILA